jgi:hypothetical protein
MASGRAMSHFDHRFALLEHDTGQVWRVSWPVPGKKRRSIGSRRVRAFKARVLSSSQRRERLSTGAREGFDR